MSVCMCVCVCGKYALMIYSAKNVSKIVQKAIIPIKCSWCKSIIQYLVHVLFVNFEIRIK